MQFNLVVVSNVKAVSLWSKLGFETAAKITKGLEHPTLGYVDALVLYKWLRNLIRQLCFSVLAYS